MKETPLIRQLLILSGALFATFSAGAGAGLPSILLYQLKRNDTDIPVDLDQATWIGSIHGLAGIPGTLAPLMMQWKGRKITFIFGCLIVIAGWAITFTASNVAMVLASESLHGFGANVLIAVSYDTLSEMITPAYRNVALQSYNVVNLLGVAMPGAMASILHWRNVALILGFPAVIGILISCSWLESPLWLAYKGKFVKCRTNFRKVRGEDPTSTKELQEVMAAYKETLNTSTEANIRRVWRQITSRDFLLPSLHIFLLMAQSYLSGFVVILMYSIELISKSTQNQTAAFVGSIIINFSIVLGMVICGIVIKKFNNKPVILCSVGCGTICLVGVAVVTYLQSVDVLNEKSMVVLYFLVGYMISSSLGQTSVGFTMASELMPVKYRGLGGAWFVICACSLHASSLKISPYLFMFIGLWGTFLIYSTNSLVCGLLVWKYVPETKDKTLQEIENYYKHGTFEIKLLDREIEIIHNKE